MNDKLIELALEYGPDFAYWPETAQEIAVVALFMHDEREKPPNWIADCLVERVACVDETRGKLLEALCLSSPVASEAWIGSLVRDALLRFPRDWLADYIEQHYDDWMARERTELSACAAECRHDAAREDFRRDLEMPVAALIQR